MQFIPALALRGKYLYRFGIISHYYKIKGEFTCVAVEKLADIKIE
jgi:hypothetical protein